MGSPYRPGRTQGPLEAVPLHQDTLAVVLAGGRGTRLMELTEHSAKPALPFAGSLRIIDYTLGNCVNSGLRRILVLTQHAEHGLKQHLAKAWSFLDPRGGEFVEALSAPCRAGSAGCYRGTADAVFQHLDLLRRLGARRVLVLAGDHVYRMDYRCILAELDSRGAGALVASLKLPAAQCRGFGVLRLDADGRIVDLIEKPPAPERLAGGGGLLCASMGVYLFDTDFLHRQLVLDAADALSSHDFGRDVLPRMIRSGRVYAHDFVHSCVGANAGEPYWRDVGTLDAYWRANVDTLHLPGLRPGQDDDWPIHGVASGGATGQSGWPGSFVAADSEVHGAELNESIVFATARVGAGCRLDRSLVLPGAVVGRRVVLCCTIVAPGSVVPDGMQIGVHRHHDRNRFRVSDEGVTLVTPEMLARAGMWGGQVLQWRRASDAMGRRRLARGRDAGRAGAPPLGVAAR